MPTQSLQGGIHGGFPSRPAPAPLRVGWRRPAGPCLRFRFLPGWASKGVFCAIVSRRGGRDERANDVIGAGDERMKSGRGGFKALRAGGAQDQRIVRVETPLGKDILLLHAMHGAEQLGRLFTFQLDLLSGDANIDMDLLLGQTMCVTYRLPTGGERYFHGFVSDFGFVGEIGEYAHYQATLRPWLWLLTRTADCRIFQNRNVPDIVSEVFADNGFSDYEMHLFEDYREWEYCVQYRETDFNFVSRLLEQEGIYYYFRHERDKHVMVLCDSISAHDPFPGYEVVPYHPSGRTTLEEHIHHWRVERHVQPGRVELNDFNPLAPRADLRANRPHPRDHAHADHEIYDYPGEYQNKNDGEQYARVRIEELQASHVRMHGVGDVGGIAPGHLFELIKHARDDQNQEYLVLRADYELRSQDFESGGDGSPDEGYFQVDFSVQPSREAYRPPRITPKPVVQGPQTAIVTGPAGEEIYPDEYGRVKVQFHWDRRGGRNENSSCWIRVSQLWAGKQWGAMHIPRIGQEVIVDFLEADPDRPIIIGRVYNADNMPPYALPENKTQSGVKSRSSKGGNGETCNELRFEDKMGEELITLHAEKDQSIEVENNERHWVGNDRSKVVGHDEMIEIKHDRATTIRNDEFLSIEGKRQSVIYRDDSLAVVGDREEEIGGRWKVTVKQDHDANITGGCKISAGTTFEVSAGASAKLSAPAIDLQAMGKITLSVGASSITLTPAMISISAPLVKIN